MRRVSIQTTQMCMMRRHTSFHRPVYWCAGAFLAVIAMTGCSTRLDPSYHRYNPTNNRPTPVDCLELITGTIDHCLDNFEERVENTLY